MVSISLPHTKAEPAGFDVEDVLSKLDMEEKVALISGMLFVPRLYPLEHNSN
jgi:hypothetical protein